MYSLFYPGSDGVCNEVFNSLAVMGKQISHVAINLETEALFHFLYLKKLSCRH